MKRAALFLKRTFHLWLPILLGLGLAFLVPPSFLLGFFSVVILSLLYEGEQAKKVARVQGWLDGRSAMIQSMNEARQRGLTPEEWIISEGERDAVFAMMTLMSKRRAKRYGIVAMARTDKDEHGSESSN